MSKQLRYNFCTSSFLYNSVQSYRDKILILDTRDYENFDTHSVSGSISVSPEMVSDYLKTKQDSTSRDLRDVTPEILAETMSEKELERYSQRRRIFCFLIVSEARFPEELLLRLRKITGADEFVDFFEVSQKHIDDDLKSAVQQMDEHGPVTFGLQLFETLQKDRVRELFILLDGASTFFERYPYMDPSFHPSASEFVRTKSLMAAKVDVTYNFPNDILNTRLFLGSFNQASQDIIVKSLETTHIINVTAECKNVYEERGIKYLHVVILDETEVTLSVFFKQVYDFIENALNEDEKHRVLLHCALGKSRSATMTIMYLMKKFSWAYEKALTYVKMKRRIVDPNYGFLRQLEEFEKSGFEFL